MQRLQEMLPPRQLEVVTFVAKGLSNPEIAREMGLSLNTIASYMGRILEITGEKNRVLLALRYAREMSREEVMH